MANRNVIVILDIDGVMITTSMLLVDRMACFDRHFFPTTIAVLNEICERTGAKVVINSTHNSSWEGVPDVKDAMVTAGFNREHFHPTNPHTRYPSLNRSDAIIHWLEQYGKNVEDWVAADDVLCADEQHMILIDPDNGLTVREANTVIARFGGQMMIFAM